MPYELESGGYEKANKLGQSEIVNNELVQQELGEFEEKKPDTDDIPVEENTIDVDRLQPAQPRIEFVISIDGSRAEPETDEEYPENRIGFIQLATVLTKLREVRAQSGHKFVDPQEVGRVATSFRIRLMPTATK